MSALTTKAIPTSPDVDARAFRRAALALPDVEARPHFDREAFRTPRKIFATLAADGLSANLMLEPDHQAMLVAQRPEAYQPVPGGWGKQGATTVVLAALEVDELEVALSIAYGLAKPAAKVSKRSARPKSSAKKAPRRPV